MLTIKQTKDNLFRVTHWNSIYSDVKLRTLKVAEDLCRLRKGTTLAENNLLVIKVPFVNLWFVW